MTINLRRISTLPICALLAFTIFNSPSWAAAFTVGNLVVCRAGVGGATPLTISAHPVFLDEYTTAGVFVQSIAIPTTAALPNHILTLSGTAESECFLTRSTDGRYIFLAGYDASVGTPSPNGQNSSTVQRVIARVDRNGSVDTSTTTTAYSSSNIRGVVSDNGTNIWLTGSTSGILYTTFSSAGSGTVIAGTPTSGRAINIVDDQLYISAASNSFRFATVGTGLPTTSGQTVTNLPGFPTSGGIYYSFYFADLSVTVPGVDTAYIADETSGTTGGLHKYSLVGGTWVRNGNVAGGIRGLTGFQTSTLVTLYATGTAVTANTLVTYSDTSGYNARPSKMGIENPSIFESLLPGPSITLATAPSNTAFRGVAFAPVAPSAAGVGVSGRILNADGRGIGRVLVTLTGGSMSGPRYFTTNAFGYYRFEDISVGMSYVVSVASKQYTFAEPTRLITLNDGIQELDFTARPR